jgi:uncharacterized repeat protein (TIGR03803 family)
VPLGNVIFDSSGDLFGTTQQSGSGNDGTVYEVRHGATTITDLVTFNGTNGSEPEDALVLDTSGNLYGTTTFGGANSEGTLFEIPSGTTTLNTLVSFNGTNGAQPTGGLLFDTSGNLYGTTTSGGANLIGNVFELPASRVQDSFCAPSVDIGRPICPEA